MEEIASHRSLIKSTKPSAKILVVDDNPTNIVVLHTLLDCLNQIIVDVDSGERAVELTKNDDFAVILLDVLMPGIGGFETVRQLRNNQRSRHTPVILLTAGNLDRAEIEKGYALGAVDFLVKPLLPLAVQAKVKGFVELFLDRQQARHEAEQLRLLVEQTVDYAIFMLNPAGNIVTWNSGAARLKGYSAEEIIGQHFSKFYPQEAIDRAWPQHELTVAETAGRFEDEGWRIRKDGSQFWANVVITALRDQGGRLIGYSKITRDMTDRRRAEENALRLLEESTARRVAEANGGESRNNENALASVTSSSIGDAVISTDAQGRIEFLNPVAEQLLGWKTDEAAGQSLPGVFKIVNEFSRLPVENPVLRALEEGVIVGLANHTLLISRDGTERPIDDCAAPIRDVDGGVMGSVLVFRDISEKKQREQTLQQTTGRLQLALEAGRMSVWDMDLQTNTIDRLSYFEPPGSIPTSFPPQTLADFERLVHRDDLPAVRQAMDQARRQGTGFNIEFRNIRPDGGLRWIAGKGQIFPGADGRPGRLLGIGIDVTQRKRSEQTSMFLADASAALAILSDFDVTLSKIATLAVPDFADWVAVDLLEGGVLRRVAVAHIDPSKIAVAEEMHR